MAAGNGAGFDEPSHRCAVAGEVAFDFVGGVGVRIEVHDAHVAVAVDVGDGGRGGPGDRVVAAQDDGHDAARRDGVHPLSDVVVRDLGLPVQIGRAHV